MFYFGVHKSIGLSLKGVIVSHTEVSYYLSEVIFSSVLIENFDIFNMFLLKVCCEYLIEASP